MPEARSSIDETIDLYMRDVDTGLNREQMKLTPEQRLSRMIAQTNFLIQLKRDKLRIRCASLPKRIQLKRAAGRTRDFELLAQLEARAQKQDQSDNGQA